MTATTQSATVGKYIPSLDGLRAISVGIVMAGHLFRWIPIPGGFGVTVFFMISGYLITTLLLREWDKAGRIDFKGFYARRVLRLMPPLLVTIAIGVLCVMLGLAEGTLDPGGVLAMIFFYFNYWTQFNSGSPVAALGVVWSLAVEEHFYMLFPALLLGLLKAGLRTRVLVVLSLAVLVWRSCKYLLLGAQPFSIYLLTDTRIDSILWGCVLAVMMAKGQLPRDRIGPAAKWSVLTAAFVVIMACFVIRDPVFRTTIRYTLQSLALMPIIYFAVHDANTPLFRPLNWGWMRWIGIWSYTIYLCHKLILDVLQSLAGTLNGNILGAVTVTLSLVYAAAMYRLVEAPFRRWRARLHANAEARSGAPAQEGAT